MVDALRMEKGTLLGGVTEKIEVAARTSLGLNPASLLSLPLCEPNWSVPGLHTSPFHVFFQQIYYPH